MAKGKKDNEIKWDKLDNTAHLFPVIANETMTSVYRISVTLKEEIKQELLQEALEMVLPWFDVFNSRLKRGFFWYYFETNRKNAPKVVEENTYPCLYMEPYTNNNYLFRVTYYKKRINLEVFHVLTDGMGAINFLRELVYQYLRLSHKELREKLGDHLTSDTSLNREDSYIKNYKKSHPKVYKTEKAFLLKGEFLQQGQLGVIHGYLPIAQLKDAAHKRNMSINQYLVGILVYSIYKEWLHEAPNKRPVTVCVPVNLRPYFDSITTKNFFAVVTAVFRSEKEQYTFEEVLEIVKASLVEQINKENLENLISYNVSNEKKLVLRAVPLFIKILAMKYVYRNSARANTTTLTNIGSISIAEDYKPYIEKFHVVLSMTKGQNMKSAICSYDDTLVFNFSSCLKDVSIQKAFFRTLSKEGIDVTIESNGVYYE